MRFQPMRFISSLLATALTAVLLVAGAPAASNAGTADYLYKCNYYGTTSGSFTIRPGDPLTTCDNAQIVVYLNGSAVDRYYTDDAGMRNHYSGLSSSQWVACIFAIGSGIYGVKTSSGAKRIINIAIAGGGIPACRAS